MNPEDAELFDFISRRTAEAPPERLAADESFWSRVREAYAPPTEFIHLEYGYYHPSNRAVLEIEIATLRANQQRAAFYKRTQQVNDLERARADIADLAGVSTDELILTRNTTESLNVAIHGIALESGDEVIHTNQDYPSIDEAWEQRAARDGIVLRRIKLPARPATDDEVVDAFTRAISSKTRVLHVTHLIHFTGQILPVQRLCSLARSHGLAIIVDSAHAFAHLDFKVSDIDCDFLSASLHKWLGAPLTLGMLYVRRGNIESTRPLFADTRLPATDVRKLEHFGNRPDTPHLGAIEAIRWHRALTPPVKLARLRYLHRRWAEPVRKLSRVTLLTPSEPHRHGAIGTFSIVGKSAKAVAEKLFHDHKIFVNAIVHQELDGVRVTPGLPSSADDVDRLAAAIETIANSA